MAPSEPAVVTPVRCARVAEVMTPDPVVVRDDARASEAFEAMQRHQVKHLPVVRDDQLVALVSERHLRDAMPSVITLKDPEARQRFLALTPVMQIAIRAPQTVSSQATVLQAIGKLRQVRGGSLPVVDGGRLVGILTTGDLLDYLDRMLRESGDSR